MALTDLFNPSFFMFLGILVLAVALLVVYFESKFRDQNHKIASMLSLVSSLAEEVNGTKMIIHQLTAMPQQAPFFYQNKEPVLESKIIKNNDSLITVSDDESESESDESESESDEESIDDESDEESIDSDSDDEQNNTNIKIFKLNISGNDEDSESDEIDGLDEIESSDVEEESSDAEEENSVASSVASLDLETNDVKTIDNFMDLKSINITLEETKTEEPIDYKKMAIPKLRSVVAEKGLSQDSSKLKKNELLKLLGVE